MIEGEGEGEIDGGQSWADLLSVAPCRQYCYREQEQQGQENGEREEHRALCSTEQAVGDLVPTLESHLVTR